MGGSDGSAGKVEGGSAQRRCPRFILQMTSLGRFFLSRPIFIPKVSTPRFLYGWISPKVKSRGRLSFFISSSFFSGGGERPLSF